MNEAAPNIVPIPAQQSGFERHGINHVSPSSINTFAAAPCFWVAKYLLGAKSEAGLAAKVGMLVEEAVVSVLARAVPPAQAIGHAEAEFAKASALGCTDADRKRGEGIPDMISQALVVLTPYGKPEFEADVTGKLLQKKVELTCRGEGFAVPVIGYLDFVYPVHGKIIDLKTTMRMPTEMSDSHRRQQAIYQKFGQNQKVEFLYVTPKKSQTFSCDAMDNALAEVKAIVTRMERFLRAGDSKYLASIVPVIQDSFYWNGCENLRREIYGI